MAGDEGRKNSDRNSVETRIVVRRRGCFGIGIVGGFMYVSMIILFWYSHKYIEYLGILINILSICYYNI